MSNTNKNMLDKRAGVRSTNFLYTYRVGIVSASALIFCFAIGFLLRAYDFSSQLLFSMDQARDWRFIVEATEEGVGRLPLVGARAGGTDFYLGPAYQYLQYASAKIFGASPQSMAYPDLLFGVLFIPILFFFLREFFSRRVSLLLSVVASTSLFLVEYSRFSWNPNTLPFFTVLGMYGLLRFSRSKRNGKRFMWLGIASFSLSFSMQLHGLALVFFPIVVFLYGVVTRLRFSVKEFLFAAGILLMLFFPMGMNEVIVAGENSRNFINAAFQKGDTREEHSWDKKLFKNGYDFVRHYSLILFSQEVPTPLNRVQSSDDAADLMRRNIVSVDEKVNMVIATVLAIVYCAGLILLWRLVQDSVESKEKRTSKKNFFWLVILSQCVAFFLFFPVAIKQDTRYYLLIAFIPFVILGAYLETVKQKWKKIGFALGVFICFFLVATNLNAYREWTRMVKTYAHSSEYASENKGEYILEGYYIATLSQMELMAEHIAREYGESDQYGNAVSLDGSIYFVRPLQYLLIYKYAIPVTESTPKYLPRSYSGLFYFVRESDKLESDGLLPDTYGAFTPMEVEDFGTLSLISIRSNTPPSYDEPYENARLLKEALMDRKQCITHENARCRFDDIIRWYTKK